MEMKWHQVVKVEARGKQINKVAYVCPSKAAAQKIARELRMVGGGKYSVRPCS